MKTENLPANPYELPPHSEDGYIKDATRWSGGMALGQPSSESGNTTGGKQHTQRIVADSTAGVCSAKAREAHYRMRYRRTRRVQTPAFIRRWG